MSETETETETLSKKVTALNQALPERKVLPLSTSSLHVCICTHRYPNVVPGIAWRIPRKLLQRQRSEAELEILVYWRGGIGRIR